VHLGVLSDDINDLQPYDPYPVRLYLHQLRSGFLNVAELFELSHTAYCKNTSRGENVAKWRAVSAGRPKFRAMRQGTTHVTRKSYINLPAPPRTSSSFLSSSALFAYWLRSSVVSVLFSLISESFRLGNTLIIPIFGPRDLASVLAHASLHSVIGLTLPPIDATTFSSTVRLVRALGEEAIHNITSM
jgi:hypothetical protein